MGKPRGPDMIKEHNCTPEKGDWVLFVKDDIVACDKNAKKIIKIAAKYNRRDVIISKEPISNHCFY
jgi:hypothetical protein